MPQSLNMVFGGKLKNTTTKEFRNSDEIDIDGIYQNYEAAYSAWKAKAHQPVNNAHKRC